MSMLLYVVKTTCIKIRHSSTCPNSLSVKRQICRIQKYWTDIWLPQEPLIIFLVLYVCIYFPMREVCWQNRLKEKKITEFIEFQRSEF